MAEVTSNTGKILENKGELRAAVRLSVSLLQLAKDLL
jgi:hypothetical protein